MSFKQVETPKVVANSFLTVATSKSKHGPSFPSVFGSPFAFSEDLSDSSCNSVDSNICSSIPQKRKHNHQQISSFDHAARIVPDTYITDTQATTQFDEDEDEESLRGGDFFSSDQENDNDTPPAPIH